MIGSVALKGGGAMPKVGIGTWRMGEDAAERETEVRALRHAHDLGFRHFDTAEMYGDAESVLGSAMEGRDRDALFICSKVLPSNAGRRGMRAACERSLEKLGLGYLDLYLLHWPGGVDIAETVDVALELKDAGLIRAFGISNFDSDGMREFAERGLADAVEVNQVMYAIIIPISRLTKDRFWSIIVEIDIKIYRKTLELITAIARQCS